MAAILSSSLQVLRSALLVLVATGILFPQLYQSRLCAVYDKMYHSQFYRLSTFETILTISCYIILEPLYTYKFGHHPSLRIDKRTSTRKNSKRGGDATGTKLPKMRRPSKRFGELLIYAAPLLLLDFTMIKKFAGVPINDIRISGGYEAVPLDNETDGLLSSLFGRSQNITQPINNIYASTKSVSPSFLLPTLHNFTIASPLQLVRALPPSPPSTRRLLLELGTSFFIYDFLFFVFHLSLHRIRFLSKVHLQHHTHAEMHPQITNRLSVTERLGLVLLANFSLNIIGSHVLTRTLFVPLFVYLLIEVHCGMDLPYGYEKMLPSGWGAGPREHARHHRTGEGMYAPFFTWWDKALAMIERSEQG